MRVNDPQACPSMSSRFGRHYAKLKKLSLMGPREIVFRLGRKAAEMAERVSYATRRANKGPTGREARLRPRVNGCPGTIDLPGWWLCHMRKRQEPPFLLDAPSLQGAADLYPRLFPGRLDRVVAKADRALRGELSFLGIEVRFPDSIPWQQDPSTGRPWPSRFYADLRIPFCENMESRDGLGDVKYVWELNRHEFLIDVAKAFYLTGDSRYARSVFRTIESWAQENPYLQGVNWAGPLEVAVRSLAWLWAYQFVRGWQDVSAALHWELIQAFYQHGAYLHRHLEFYSAPNNHLVGEAAALYLLGSFFPEFDESPAWRRLAWGILAVEPEKQFYEDGGSKEHSNYYHHYCLGFFLLAMLTRLRQGQPVPEVMRQRLEAALSFSMWMTTPDGTVPRVGDGDDARSIRFTDAPFWDFRSMLGLGAVVFHRPDMKAVARSFSEDALWLLGPAAYETYQALPAQVPAETSRVFPTSGYVILRSGWGRDDHHLCFDAGPLGDGLYTADVPAFSHGHADMLSLCLSAFGKPLLVDAGFYTFSGSPVWNRYCRDVQGHNTISVDGASPAKFNVAGAWSCVARPGPIHWESSGQWDSVAGSHTGFHGVDGRVAHRRTIVWKRDSSWLILDRLEGEGTHQVEVFFHFSPGTAVAHGDSRGVLVSTEDGVHAVLRLVGADSLRAEIKHGGEEPDGGWIATSYGRCVPAPLVRFSGRVPLPISLTFALGASRTLPVDCDIEPESVRWPEAMEQHA